MLDRLRTGGKGFDVPSGMTTGDPRIDWAIARIEEAPERPLRVTEMARAVNLSPSQVTRLFRLGTGDSPARYLRLRRLQRARVLIENTFLSIKEVMQMVGVNDPSHFTRDFTRVHGVSPSRLRAAARADRPMADAEHGR
jgi:transcriptional regulator GlxA family with amidase domain